MIITTNLKGGVGNQMFQIANAYRFSRKFNIELLFQKNQFEGCIQGSHPSKYYSSIFANLQFVDDISNNNKHIITESTFEYSDLTDNVRSLLESGGDKTIFFDGYFQSEKYFEEYSIDIKKFFTPSIGILQYLENYSDVFTHYPELKMENDFCFIGVRRGDYITYANIHNPCGMVYYQNAMDRMQKDVYYIMTDDIQWVKSHFIGPQYRYLEIQDDLIKLLTIALFKNHIISNSTFYWWGSYLSIHDDLRIIAPDKWINVDSDYRTIYRSNMEVLERPVEIN